MPRGGIGATAIAIGIALVASGCGWLAAPGQGVGSGCQGFQASGACAEQAEVVAARHPGASQVDLTCVGLCDRRSGSGTAVVTMANGETTHDTFSYVGNGAAMPVPACAGLAFNVCQKVAAGQFADQPVNAVVTAISVTCTAAPCTLTKGEADFIVRLGDGTTQTGGMSWDGGLP